ncbi:autotransporter domain-containing protein [Luteibacter pinisoli]|uniref:Autotransporter domain-containing protein n=1 Tax=Luteibacter pinisoli TaxID=2589080 RepID=A0A4Y5YZU0_9GAMM|nr:autotransporter domain-containing protein [Luteibacter pinisoli]QDE37909.1 autotransporter domain-containing protein [Luteibacter pinisoli]
MEAWCGAGAAGRMAVGKGNKPGVLALAVMMALGLSACGGGGGGGNVRSTPSAPSTPTSPTNPTNPGTPAAYSGGAIDVAANTTTTIADNLTGSVGVAKGGDGTLTFTGTNTYTGETQVNAGSLYINGDQSGATGATTVGPLATLGGAGVIGGDVTVGSNATLAPGQQGAIGTLTINGNLTLTAATQLNAGSQLNFDFAQASGGTQASDLINVKGNLTLAGTLNVNVAGGGDLGPGVHRLINYDGGLVDNGLSLGSLASTSWALQTGVAHQVNLIDTRGMNFSVWDGAGPKGNNVIDGGSGEWTAGGPDTSWTDASGAVNAHFNNGTFAIFQGTPGTVTVNNDNGAVVAGGMQFASDGYLIQGDPIQLSGSTEASYVQAIFRVGDGTQAGAGYKATVNNVLTGIQTLVKTDAGTLVLGGDNTYSGGTVVSGGTLQIGNGGTSGSVMGDITDNATLVFNRSNDTVYGGTISGTGNLVKTGSGSVSMSMRNTFAGGTQVKGGTLRLDLGGELGTGDIIVGNAADRAGIDPVATLKVGTRSVLGNNIFVQGNGVVDNAGVIGGTNDNAIGSNYTFGASPTVLNHDGGLIRGNRVGVLLRGDGATVANSSGGSIEGGDTAVELDYSGSVSNDGAGTMINSMTGVGIHLGDKADVMNVNGATISSAKTAVYMSNGGSLTNGAGSTIQSAGTASGDCAVSNACAVLVQSTGPAYLASSGAVTFNNAGTIIGNVQFFAPAANKITLTAGGSIQGDLTIGASTLTTMTLAGSAGSVQRYSQAVTGNTTFSSGVLAVTSPGKWIIDNSQLTPGAVQVSAGSTLQIGDGFTSGSITTGVIGNRGTVIFDRSDDVTFTGGIVGQLGAPYDDVMIKAGAGRLTVPIGGFAPSNIIIEAGTLQIDNTGNQPAATFGYVPMTAPVQNFGSLVFDSYENYAATRTISGTGSLTQDGSGVLFLDGQNTYTGGTTINKGTIRTNHAMPGNVLVNQAGTLDGDIAGSPGPGPGLPGVAGNLINAGRVAVHGGDAAIGGNYTQASTGTLALSLGSKLAVAGTATLSGGTLEITGADSGYVSNAHTEVLTATQGLTGTFGQLVKDTGVVFTANTISYDGHSAWLDTAGLNVTTAAAGNGVSYTSASLNSAQRVQGAFTQLNSKIATGDTASVSPGFVQAAGAFQQAPTLQAAQASLQSLSGQLHAASAAMTFEAIDASGRALSDHFDDVLGKKAGFGTWTQNLSVGGDMGRAGYDGVGFQLNGWLVGSDRQVGSSGVAGFAFGQSQGQQQLDQSNDHNRSRSTEGMLYAGWLNGNWYTQGRVGFGHFQQDVSRQLLLGTSAAGVSTNYSGNYNVAYGETGLHLDMAGTRVMPFVNVEYASINRGGFTEQGADGFGLRTDGQTLDRWQAGAGLRAARHWTLEDGRGVDFTVGAQFRRTLASHGDVFDASFVGLSQWQPLAGIGLSRYSGVLNLGLNAALSARTSLKLGYDYEKGQRDQSQVLSAHWMMAL